MDCANIDRNELAEKYLNGRLEEAKQDDFEIHILECEKCLQIVETLQAVHFDLSERAPAIRTQTPIKRPFWLRWQWAAVACLLLIVGGSGLRKLHRTGVEQQSSVQHTADQNPSSSALGIENSETTIARNDKEFVKKNRQLPRSEGRAVASHNVDTSTAEKHPDTPDHGDLSNNSSSSRSSLENTVESPAVAATAKTTPPTDQTSKDLAELAAVRPFPYTFAGVASTQPTSGGSVRVQHPSATGISEAGGTGPKAGAGGFSTAQDYFRDGMTAYVNRDYTAASQLLSEAIRLDPELSEAHLYLGICRLLQGNATEAISALQPVSRARKPALAQPAHFYLAKAYLQLGKLDDADRELRATSSLPGRLAGESDALMKKLEDVRSAFDKK